LSKLSLVGRKVKVVLRQQRWESEFAFREEEEAAPYFGHMSIGESRPPVILL
jgi:hypothetical protein